MNREKAFSHPSSLSPLPPHLALPSHSWMCPRVPLCATSTGATLLPALAENCRYCVSGPGEAPTSTRRGIKAACSGTLAPRCIEEDCVSPHVPAGAGHRQEQTFPQL